MTTQEARIVRLEEIVGEIRDGLNRIDRIDTRMDSNFRWVLGVVITMSSTTTLAMIAGFVAILAKI